MLQELVRFLLLFEVCAEWEPKTAWESHMLAITVSGNNMLDAIVAIMKEVLSACMSFPFPKPLKFSPQKGNTHHGSMWIGKQVPTDCRTYLEKSPAVHHFSRRY